MQGGPTRVVLTPDGTDEMFIEAGQAVADLVPPERLQQGLLYPLQSNILEAEIQTAARVAELIFDSGLARVGHPADMVASIRQHVYKPEYTEALLATRGSTGRGSHRLPEPSATRSTLG